MDDVKGEDVDGKQRQRECEQVEISVVPLSYTVSDPRTMMVKTVWGENTHNLKTLMKICESLFLHYNCECASSGRQAHVFLTAKREMVLKPEIVLCVCVFVWQVQSAQTNGPVFRMTVQREQTWALSELSNISICISLTLQYVWVSACAVWLISQQFTIIMDYQMERTCATVSKVRMLANS